MNILFLMYVFPNMNKSFNMYTTLVEEFSKNGHNVYVVAPGTNSTKIEIENKLPILRVKTLPTKNIPNYIKGISNLLLPRQYEKAISKYYSKEKYDLIVTSTPPITFADLATSLKIKHGAKLYLILRDIFPQNAVDLEYLKVNSFVYRYFRKKEVKMYKSANYIGCMSHGNIEYIIKYNSYIDRNKLHELKNFQKPYINDLGDYNNLRDKYGINNKFVVIFGGNIGKPQQLENVLELAKNCSSMKDVLFILLGEGLQMRHVKKIKNKLGLENVIIKETISKIEYQYLLSICDLGLISLHEKFTIPNIPSKALDYFNVGIPILASIDRATDFGQILDESQAGLWSYAGDHNKFMGNFIKLYENKNYRQKLGDNGKLYFLNNLTPERAYNTIINEVQD